LASFGSLRAEEAVEKFQVCVCVSE
jgi:hypothetical protein